MQAVYSNHSDITTHQLLHVSDFIGPSSGSTIVQNSCLTLSACIMI